MTTRRRPARPVLTGLFAVGAVAVFSIISWNVAAVTALFAFYVSALETETLVVIALALITVVLAIGGPLLGIWVGRLIWRGSFDELPPVESDREPDDTEAGA